MNGHRISRNTFWTGAVFGVLATLTLGPLVTGGAGAWAGAMAAEKDNEELARLYREDQADRDPKDGKPLDWAVVGPRDRAREERVKELYKLDRLKTGNDYSNAAMVLQHGQKPEDYLLAHELCVVAISKGNQDARWLAAAAEDRFLMNLNRPQRFGTQYRSTPPDGSVKLYEVDPSVTDAHRRAMNTPTLAKAKEREAEMDAIFRGKKP
jgi:hypothetical protein